MDEFFQTERDHNLVLTGCAKTAAEVSQSPVRLSSSLSSSLTQPDTLSCVIFELLFSLQRFLDVVQTEQSKQTLFQVWEERQDVCISWCYLGFICVQILQLESIGGY